MQKDSSELETLYRKACSDFPLKKMESDWDYVSNKLNEENKKKPLAFWYRLLMAFTLFVTVGFGIYSMYKKSSFNNSNNVTDNIANIQNQQVKSNTTNQKQAQRSLQESEIIEAVYKKILDSLSRQQSNKTLVPLSNNLNYEKENPAQNSVIVNPKIKHFAPTLPKLKQLLTKPNKNTNDIANEPSNNIVLLKVSNDINGDSNKSMSLKTDTNIKSKPNVDSLFTHSKKQELPNKKTSKKQYYFGVLTNTEISSSHRNKRISEDEPFDLGFLLIAGINLNKTISIETGLGYKQKTFYRFDDNFNTNFLQLKGTFVDMEVETQLIELPLTLRFNLLKNDKHFLFTNIGISSYIMLSEYYEYEEDINGLISKEKIIFKNFANSFFVTTNIGLGYEYVMKNKLGFRLQSYYSIPLNGLGKSNTAVTSKGLRFGVIYHL